MNVEARWPPIYDFGELERTIREIAKGEAIEKRFYDGGQGRADFFQGDVILFDVELPYVNGEAEPVADEPPPFWAVLGNTCDLNKAVEHTPFTQLVPIFAVGDLADLPEEERNKLYKYRAYTQFAFPSWKAPLDGQVLVADFLRPVTVHKSALVKASVEARLSRAGWILFHSCIVRFLARDDGRND